MHFGANKIYFLEIFFEEITISYCRHQLAHLTFLYLSCLWWLPLSILRLLFILWLGKQFINFILQLYWARMTRINNITFCINKSYEGNALNLEVLYQWMIMEPTPEGQMLNFVPPFCCNSGFNCLCIVIDTHSHNFNFIPPIIFLEHFLIMCHRFLARPTPSCPNID